MKSHLGGLPAVAVTGFAALVLTTCDEPGPRPATGAIEQASSGDSAVVDELLAQLDIVEDKVLGLAQAFDAEVYEWRPADGVRSAAEVFMHMNAINHAFPMFVGRAAPERTGLTLENVGAAAPVYEASLQGRDEIRSELAASFAHLRTAIEATSSAQLTEEVVVFGGASTVRAFWIDHVGHLREHLGQLIAYGRTNGVAPPW